LTAARPFVKWTGGKRKLLPKLLPLVPEDIGTYYEPFLGGGALFFALASEERPRRRFDRAVLSDANVELVRTYRAIQQKPDLVLKALGDFKHTKEYFLAVRSHAPGDLDDVECAARLIYLTKTCINGLYRVNSKGKFNAAFGRYPTMDRFVDPEVIHACSRALQDVQITAARWDEMLRADEPGLGDFVYLDPPYVPVSDTANFTGYVAGGFGMQDQSNLCTWALAAAARGVRVMVSNSDADWVRRNYRAFHIHQVERAGTTNSDADKREPVPELIMRSKDLDAATTQPT